MGNVSLQHDSAFDTSKQVLAIFVNLLREDEQRAALWEIYEVVLQGLKDCETKAARRVSRLNPSGN
jgi:hypothetical protein